MVRKEGDVEAALKGADKVIVGEYYLPHLAHVAMEPPVAVADVKGDKAEIWAPVQSAGGTREDVAKTLGIPEENVTVNVTLLGGGFGRKSKCDFAHRGGAAVEGARRAGEGAVDARGRRPQRLPAHRVGRAHRGGPRQERQGDRRGGIAASPRRIASTFAAGCQAPGAVRTRHGAGRHAVRDRQHRSARIRRRRRITRIGWFRSVSNIPRAFAVQSMVGEIAQATGRDQKDMLLELIGSPRIVKLDCVKDLWNYGEPYEQLPDRHRAAAQGRRAGRREGRLGPRPCRRATASASPRIAASSAISPPSSRSPSTRRASSTVPRVDTAIDCGTYVNPERIHSQIEGAAIMGAEPRQVWRDHLQGRQGASRATSTTSR